METKTLWLVLQFICETEHEGRKGSWSEFQGIFTTKEQAIAACVQDNFCVVRVVLDEEVTLEATLFPHMWYPRLEHEPVEA